MRKAKPRKGNKIIMISTYVENSAGTWSMYGDTLYYVDTKRRKIWEEEGVNMRALMIRGSVFDEPIYHTWAGRKSQRSVAALVRKYHSDYEKLKGLFGVFELEVTEVGVL